MLDAYIDKISLVAMIAVWLFAWMKGGPAERWGATLLAINWIATAALIGVAPRDLVELITLASDFEMAIAFLIVAIVYSSRWLGIAMFLQAIALALHADGLVNGISPKYLNMHYACLNVTYFGVQWAVAAAVAATWWTRRRRAKAAKVATSATAPPTATPSPA